MAEQIVFNDFSSGWMPSEDRLNGRKNGLLRMDSVELDQNGALILTGGSQRISGIQYPANAHTLYSKFLLGLRKNYVSLINGATYRDDTSIITGGSDQRTAFATVFDNVLIASGAQRWKDDGSTLKALGIPKPVNKPELTPMVPETISWFGVTITKVGSNGSISAGADYFDLTTDASTFRVRAQNIADFPKDLITFANGITTEDDIFSMQVRVSEPKKILRVRLEIFLEPPTVGGNFAGLVENYNFFEWNNDTENNWLSADLNNPFRSTVNPFNQGESIWSILECRRNQFIRAGDDSSLSWANVYGFAISVISSDAAITVRFGDFKVSGGSYGPLSGTYEYRQINVSNNGAYLAKSPMGPISDPVDVDMSFVTVLPDDPSGIDPSSQINEIWIFRRGGTLDQFYRVKILDAANPFDDTLSDIDALKLNIKLNEFLISVAFADIEEDILEIVGPIHGRMLYFTATKIYFSEIDSPDSTDSRLTINITGDNSEWFLWARKFGENTVVIGTSKDLYVLLGTYVQLPDGFLDVYLRGIGISKPPISRDVSVSGSQLFYMAAMGWIAVAISGEIVPLTVPNTDILYKGETRYEYGGVPTYMYSDIRYPCVVAKNKLWCSVPFITDYTNSSTIHDFTTWLYRMEVFDFGRKYWRPIPVAPKLLTVSEDEAILGFTTDRYLNLIDNPFDKRLNVT